LCRTNPNRIDDQQSIIGWIKLGINTFIKKIFNKIVKNYSIIFQNKMQLTNSNTPNSITPVNIIATLISLAIIAVKIIVEYFYFQKIFDIDIKKINSFYIDLTT
jgi:hypothetical protein